MVSRDIMVRQTITQFNDVFLEKPSHTSPLIPVDIIPGWIIFFVWPAG